MSLKAMIAGAAGGATGRALMEGRADRMALARHAGAFIFATAVAVLTAFLWDRMASAPVEVLAALSCAIGFLAKPAIDRLATIRIKASVPGLTATSDGDDDDAR